VDVLASLLRFALDVCAPLEPFCGATGAVVVEAPAAALAARVLAVLINLAMSPPGAARCAACAPLKELTGRAFRVLDSAVGGDVPPPPPLVLSGHAASLTPY
jgi:hypothetical protein